MFSLEAENVVQQRFNQAKLDREFAQSELERRRQEECFWDQLLRFLREGMPLHFLDLVERENARLKALRNELPDHASLIEGAYRTAKDEEKKLFKNYPSLLERAFSEGNLPLDRTSRHPRYTLRDGFFVIEIDEGRRIARLSDTEGRLDEITADVKAVLEITKRQDDRVFNRNFKATDFLKLVRRQYLALIQQEKKQDGQPVPIRSITRRLGKNKKRFRTDEFLIDLSRLAQSGQSTIQGRRLDLQQTKDTNQGMLLHGSAGRGYVGFVLFRETGDE